MRAECSSCGAPSSSVSFTVPSWECDYCDQINYTQEYVENYLKNIDLSKLSKYISLGKAAFDSGNYEDAATKFDLVLQEDSKSFEAWTYKGLSLAHIVDLSNIDSLLHQIKVCSGQAFKIAPQNEFVRAADSVVRELVVSQLLRLVDRSHAEVKKIMFAFDGQEGIQRAARPYKNVFKACHAAFDFPSKSLQQMSQVCFLSSAALGERGAPRDDELLQKAQTYITKIKKENPDLSIDLPQTKGDLREGTSCFPGSVRILTPSGLHKLQRLRAGDSVFSMDRRFNIIVERTVKKIVQHNNIPTCELGISGDVRSIRTTRYHIFLTHRGWRPAIKLRRGDKLIHVNSSLRIGAQDVLFVHPTKKKETVYSVYTTGECNFIADGVVAHNFTRFRWLRQFCSSVLTNTEPALSLPGNSTPIFI